MKDLGRLFFTFLKIGTFIFGGGYAMIPAIRREAVEVRGWISEEEISDCIAICQALPGAFAVNAALYMGGRVKGTLGALAALLGIALPAFLSIILVLLFLGQIQDNVYVHGALEGIKAASVALIFMTVLQMGQSLLAGKGNLIIAVLSFLMIVVLHLSAIWAVIMGGVLGYFALRWRRRRRKGDEL